MITTEDIRPWMFEPATPKQLKWIVAIARVLELPYDISNKIDAYNFITKWKDSYYEKLADQIKQNKVRVDFDRDKLRHEAGINGFISNKINGNTYDRFDRRNPNYSYDEEARENTRRLQEDKMREEIRREVLAEHGLGVGPYGEIYDLDEEP